MKRIAIIAAMLCVGGVAGAQTVSSLPGDLAVELASSELTTLQVRGRSSNAKSPRAYPQKMKAGFSLKCQRSGQCGIKVNSYDAGGDRFGSRGKEWLKKKRGVTVRSAADGGLRVVPESAATGGDPFVLAVSQLIALVPNRRADGEWKARHTFDIDAGGVFRNARVDASYRRTGSAVSVNAKVAGARNQGKEKVTLTGTIEGSFELGAKGQVTAAKIRFRAERVIDLEGNRATVSVDRSMNAKSGRR